MRAGVQSLFGSMGRSACYALCILQACDPDITEAKALSILLEAIERGHIKYQRRDPGHDDNWFVVNPAALMGMAKGDTWSVRHDKAGYEPKPGEIVIYRWDWNRKAHFRLKNWDSLIESQVVKYGQTVSTRVFTRS